MKLFRRRFFPDEIIELRDEIIFHDEDILVTKWKPIRPKADLRHGVSCFFIKKGCKVSKFYGEGDSLLYWYCDIGDCVADSGRDEFVFVDLLADVIIYPDGEMRVVDLGEAADIYEKGKFSSSDMCRMLRRLDFLLESIHNGEFRKMQSLLEKYEKE